MNMRDLTDEKRVLLAEFRMCEAQVQDSICNTVHSRAADKKAITESDVLPQTSAGGNETAGDS